MLAIGKWLFTSERASLALIAAGIVVMTYLLATELLHDKRQAALASVFMVLTPLFIVQSATFLPYAAELLMLSAFAFALFRGLRLEQGRWLMLAGTIFGIAFFARPYDAVVFTIPLAVYVFVRYRKSVRALFSRAGFVLAGLIPPGIAVAAFNRAATGSTLKSPFSLIDSRDTIGFGRRSMDPSNPAVTYTPGLGWTGLSRHVMLTMFWVFGGLVLVGCALYFLARHGWRGRVTWFAAIAVALPVGYLFFWGTYGAAVWGAPWYLGPYYYMPIFAPLVILGAGGFVLFLREYRQVAKVALVGMVVLSTFVTAHAMVKNLSFTQDDRRLYTALTRAHVHNALVFLPGFYGPRVLHPFGTAANNWNVTGDVIYAVDRGEAENVGVAADFSSRTPYLVTVTGQYRQIPPDKHLTSTLRPLVVRHGRAVDVNLDFKNPLDRNIISVVVTAYGREDTYVIDRSARRGTRERLAVHVTSNGPAVQGRVLAHSSKPTTTSSELTLQIIAANGARGAQPLYLRRLGVARRGDVQYVMLPGQVVNAFIPAEPLDIRVR
jgi:hypothetical protein